MLAWHCSPSGTQLPSLTGNMCCSLDSLIGDCLPDIALLAWLIVLAVQVNFFAKSLSPLDVPHLQAKSCTRCSHKPASKVYNDAKGLPLLKLPLLRQLRSRSACNSSRGKVDLWGLLLMVCSVHRLATPTEGLKKASSMPSD